MTTTTAGYIRQNSIVEKVISHWLFWVLFTSFVFAVPIWKSVHRELPNELPKLFKIEKLNLMTQFGERFELKHLGSRYSIAHFHDFACESCKNTLNKMQVIQKRVRGLGSNLALLSINVNPESANKELLAKTSMEYKANPFVWKMLYNENFELLKTMANTSFKGPINKTDKGMLYPEKIYLIDKEGFVRGLYNFEKESINKLMIDVGLLINSAFSQK